MTGNTLNMMHYHWAGRYFDIGLGYGDKYSCQVWFGQKISRRVANNNDDKYI